MGDDIQKFKNAEDLLQQPAKHSPRDITQIMPEMMSTPTMIKVIPRVNESDIKKTPITTRTIAIMNMNIPTRIVCSLLLRSLSSLSLPSRTLSS